jgi:hypothetical protein
VTEDRRAWQAIFQKDEYMDIVTLEKSKRDGGGFGKFRAMTLEEAKALPHHAFVWVLMTTIAQKFKTYDPGISRFKGWRVQTDISLLDERAILDGRVLVEVTGDGEPLWTGLKIISIKEDPEVK